MSRTIVVGDVHGCYDELLALAGLVNLGGRDRLVSVGDLVVKGEKSREVLELFMRDARFSSVLGNHDRALLRFWKGGRAELKPAQEKCRGELEAGRERYAAFLGSLPLFIELGPHVVVHAGLRPGVALSEQSAEDLTELRQDASHAAARMQRACQLVLEESVSKREPENETAGLEVVAYGARRRGRRERE